MSSRTKWFLAGLVVLAVFGAVLALVGAGFGAYSVVLIAIPLWLVGGLLVFIVRRRSRTP